MRDIVLNFLYLSPKHAGGKNQVGLNLLKGLYELGYTKRICVICYEYSRETIKKIADDVGMIVIKRRGFRSELERIIFLFLCNTFVIPNIVKRNSFSVLLHLSCNNGFRRLKVKTIVIPHDIKDVSHWKDKNLSIPWHKYFIYRLLYYVDFKHADKIIAISRNDCNEISTFYPKFSKKLVQIYNPIDVENFPYYKKENYICAVNLQFHHKNIITLLKAFNLIVNKTDCNLILIGNVPPRVKYLEDYVKRNQLGDRVKFLGFVTEEERNAYLSRAKLYVNPSEFEGFGMTAVEAILMKVPVLLSGIPVNLEITENLCSYYMPCRDEHELARTILVCLEKDNSPEELKCISDKIYNKYNYLQIAQEYMDLFLEMIRE